MQRGVCRSQSNAVFLISFLLLDMCGGGLAGGGGGLEDFKKYFQQLSEQGNLTLDKLAIMHRFSTGKTICFVY